MSTMNGPEDEQFKILPFDDNSDPIEQAVSISEEKNAKIEQTMAKSTNEQHKGEPLIADLAK